MLVHQKADFGGIKSSEEGIQERRCHYDIAHPSRQDDKYTSWLVVEFDWLDHWTLLFLSLSLLVFAHLREDRLGFVHEVVKLA